MSYALDRATNGGTEVLYGNTVVLPYFRTYIAGVPISYALRAARDSENFHSGAAAQILFMEPDTACDFHVAPASCAREAHTGFRNPIVGFLTA
eukprot:5752-Pelagococcus_subviridis.AAC.3